MIKKNRCPAVDPLSRGCWQEQGQGGRQKKNALLDPSTTPTCKLPGVNKFLCPVWVTKKKLQNVSGLGVTLHDAFGVCVPFSLLKELAQNPAIFPPLDPSVREADVN